MRLLLSKRKIFSKIFLLFFIVALIGWLFDLLFPALFTASVVLLGWNYRHIFVLDKWLWRDKKLTPPAGDGSWQQVFDGIYYRQRKARKKNKELRALIRRFRDGAEALPDAIVVLNSDWTIIWCNKLAQQLVGLRWPQDERQRIDNLIRNPEFQSYIQQKQFEQPLELSSPVNEDLILEYRMLQYGDDQHLLIVRDVTQLKLLEQVRKDFVANVSHELRTPLTVLQGYLEVMDADNLPNEGIWLKAHTVMLEQTKRMDALVQQLLTLSRIEAAAKVQFEDHIDVPAMLVMLEQESNTLNREKQHQISFSIEPGLLVSGIREELRSAFSNLITNAIKYTPNGGEIQVSWVRQHQKAVFSVSDNGEGIAPQHVKRLTERFYRVDQARARATGGTGLGLAIVKHVLQRHNSKLMIFSEPKKGSSFSFSLPAETLPKRKATKAR
ncbi:MAG: phosphate regulon sensor histidine kinase PhoR [Gammaproteobacteria bacterium]|nr:phosphate regulon sensor histidine kinase PhoR [Gammaproteobacteria bacterium]MBU2056374.1 phosphate regulon sensor histidine kinase PhoR [Gammaproteobacteria bacterium]MBU2177267.1 phosphate regulon sensor histidine kinase PhoR [Gammaproteobacteria bacterium]MBU2246169.1 phosphate regulon sensor histidine kinase PhoR [Gammaproteobacteria bacterium]MBU2343017.1 phosphate regulon sensor histidine kinase PhoR [Gammaproteobacteria bacterium]